MISNCIKSKLSFLLLVLWILGLRVSANVQEENHRDQMDYSGKIMNDGNSDNIKNDNRYHACLVILAMHYEYDYKDIINILFTLGHLNKNSLLEKHLYENLEYCLKTITQPDIQYIIQNMNNNLTILPKIPNYILDLANISQKLSSALTTSQNKLKKYTMEAYNDHIKGVNAHQKFIINKLDDMLAGKTIVIINENNATSNYEQAGKKVLYGIFWTLFLIAFTAITYIAQLIIQSKVRKPKFKKIPSYQGKNTYKEDNSRNQVVNRVDGLKGFDKDRPDEREKVFDGEIRTKVDDNLSELLHHHHDENKKDLKDRLVENELRKRMVDRHDQEESLNKCGESRAKQRNSHGDEDVSGLSEPLIEAACKKNQ